MEVIQIWLLVLVINGEMAEHKITYGSHADCMLMGSWFVDASVQGGEEDHSLDGFFCEEEKPDPVAQVTPVCLAPTRQCS
jgi:hypothetical protein